MNMVGLHLLAQPAPHVILIMEFALAYANFSLARH